MKLTLKNIGKISNTNIEINGITVIAGENNTGKSTVGRALFAVFNSFNNVEKQINNERIESLENTIRNLYFNSDFNRFSQSTIREIARSIYDKYSNGHLNDSKKIKTAISNLLSEYEELDENVFSDEVLDGVAERIYSILCIKDEEFLNSVLQRNLDAEFDGQICNIFNNENGEITLQIKDNKIIVGISNEGDIDVENSNNISLRTDVVYLDDPFVLDEQYLPLHRRNDYFGHRNQLRKKIYLKNRETNVFDEIVTKEILNSIYKKINSVCSGEVVDYKRLRAGYRRKDSDKILYVKNLSTGLKSFVILKMLLQGGGIEQNGTIILDEPEIHLHPQWQLLFAELIVLIQKEFGVHILLNTHSPYFLNALEVYAAKYSITNVCKYYLATNVGNISVIDDVTDNIEAIYQKLAKPLQELENEKSNMW